MAVAEFIVMVCLLVIDIILLTFAPETKGLELTDTPANAKVVRELRENENNASNERDQVSEIALEDIVEAEAVSVPTKPEQIVLEIVEEEDNSDDDKGTKNSDTGSDNETVDCQEGSPAPNKTKFEKLKAHFKDMDLRSESGSGTPSPRGSPALKLKKKKKVKDAEIRSGNGSATPSPRGSPALKLKKRVKDADLRSESGSATPSPRGSPALKLKKKHLDKLKNGDFLHGKHKTKNKEEFPPYIESSRNKNVRFSIY